MSKTNKPNQPEMKFRAGAIATTIWKNKTEKDGEVKEYRTISFDRNYQDKDGKWQTTNSLRVNDLPRAQLVLQKAYEYLVLKEQDDTIEEIIIE
jgi:BioD-like phosphotransacetylase family protein